MAEDKSSKTEKPTAKRRREAKEEGNVPKTTDLSAWLTVLVFVFLGQSTVSALNDSFKVLASEIPRIAAKPDVLAVGPIMMEALLGTARSVLPFALSCMLVGVLGHVVQGGIMITPKKFKPKWNKLNAFKGLKGMFSKQSLWTLAKTLIKFVVFGTVAYLTVSRVIAQITGTGKWTLVAILDVSIGAAMDILRWVAITGLIIAAADWAMEKRRVDQSLKMSKDEVKREFRNAEGDPLAKGQRRQKARELARQRMMAAVGESTVVLVNPTHVAVALLYEPGGGAPKVVAKGTGFIAARIREEAEKHDVPMVRDVIVTRLLYKLCEVDTYIPPELYDAIAQVIAFVFHLDGLGKAAGTHESPVKHSSEESARLDDDLSDKALRLARAGAGSVAEQGAPSQV